MQGDLIAQITRSSAIIQSPRVLQISGMFDVPPAERAAHSWEVKLPLGERDWSIGLIVGPSGCGKSTIVRELFGAHLVSGFDWPDDRAVLDAFPPDIGAKDIAMFLSSVGFSSPPSWLKPFGVLSNGEQFRVTIARALAEKRDLCVIDEFTSVVDRTVAQVGSAAVAKTVRRAGRKIIAASCHYDIIDWLDPDWIYYPAEARFDWRCLQGRPRIELAIGRVKTELWKLFAHHHYLSGDLHRGAFCFAAFINGRPVAFDAWLPFVGKLKWGGTGRIGHRAVCLPDYQGVGIGNALVERGAAMWRGLGFRAFSSTAHPALIQYRRRQSTWTMTAGARRTSGEASHIARFRARARPVTSFEFVGPALSRAEAEHQLNAWAA